LGGTFKIIWFQPPCYRQGHLPLDEVAQSPIQPGLECLQGGASTTLLGMVYLRLSLFRIIILAHETTFIISLSCIVFEALYISVETGVCQLTKTIEIIIWINALKDIYQEAGG